jgi:DUF1680 family protein
MHSQSDRRLKGIVACWIFAGLAAGAAASPGPGGPGAVSLAVQPFPPQDVRLLDSPFKRAMELDARYLLSLDPDRLLSWFRKEAGLKPKAEVYGGWESQGIAGHSLGHYLSACSRMYQDTSDTRFLDRVNYIVEQLAECQKANGDGYVAAIPNGKRIFAEIARGEVHSKDFNINGGWVPWYTLHKEFAGLIDAYRFCSNKQALTVVTNLANWAEAATARLTPDQWQTMLVCEQGGMNEALANLYSLTGNTHYLNLAEKFYHHAVMDPLARGEDRLDGLHSNMQIPKVIGAARLYELTGNPTDRAIADFFWDRVALHRSYVIGGNADAEHFFPVTHFARHLSASTCETCCTYNMLKLSRHLFQWSPDAAVMDFYERALYNDILASQDPDTGMFVYLMSLKSGGFKTYSTRDDSFWCCVGSGMENHARYSDAMYFHSDSALYVNLFIPSQLTWPEKHLLLRQETQFPAADTTRLLFERVGSSNLLDLNIRWPAWAKPPLTVQVNGQEQEVNGHPGSYITLRREWRAGDHVDIRLPMRLHTEPLPGTTNILAVLYGPIVLAGELGTNDMPASVYAKVQTKFVRWPAPPAPVFVLDSGSLVDHIKPTGHALTFRTEDLGRPEDVTLAPLYDIAHQRYAVYWNVLSESQWRTNSATSAK